MVALAPNTSQTSTWDVLNTFPKLHSRAREVKTPRCTEAPHPKSFGRVEIWLVISESCVGLESFTRDPIEYEDGESLYCAYFSIDANDPFGKARIVATPVRPMVLKAGCGSMFMTSWEFHLPNNGRQKGFLVQEVTVTCSFGLCKKSPLVEIDTTCGTETIGGTCDCFVGEKKPSHTMRLGELALGRGGPPIHLACKQLVMMTQLVIPP